MYFCLFVSTPIFGINTIVFMPIDIRVPTSFTYYYSLLTNVVLHVAAVIPCMSYLYSMEAPIVEYRTELTVDVERRGMMLAAVDYVDTNDVFLLTVS